MTYSSKLKVMVVVFFAAAFSFAVIYSIEKIYIEPALSLEHEKRVNDLPVLLAIANQKSIISNELAVLKSTLEQTLSALGQSGLRYIIIEDADGKIIAAVFHSSYGTKEQERVFKALITRYTEKRSRQADASGIDASKFNTAEREALEGSTQVAVQAAVAAFPEGYLPKIERKVVWKLDTLAEPLLDHSIPINTGAIKFGGLRVGTADDLAAKISEIRFITWGTIALLIIVVGGLGYTVSAQIDSRFEKEAAEKISEVRKELESRIKQLEVEYSRREEENPITPSEFLSLLDFARKISGTLDYNEALQIGIHSILQIMGIRDASVFVLDGTTNELVGRIGHDENGFVSDQEMAQIRVPVGKGDIGAAAEFGTTTTIDSPRPGASVVSALVSRGRTIGVILVRNKLNGRPFLKKDQTILRIFSGLLANSMDTAAIYHHLSNQ